MRTVRPSIVCIAKTEINEDAISGFLRNEGLVWNRSNGVTPGDDLIEFSGRICYMSFGERQSPRDNGEYILNLIDSGHESVLEHMSWTFVASGVSRAFTHQLVRHRVGFSYSQLSQQYYDESEACFVAPPSLKKGSSVYRKWGEAMTDSLARYREILASAKTLDISDSFEKKERSREIRSTARSVLPNAIETKIVFSANARALRGFLVARGAIKGDWEMREVSVQLFKILQKDAPSIFQDFEQVALEDGSLAVVKK